MPRGPHHHYHNQQQQRFAALRVSMGPACPLVRLGAERIVMLQGIVDEAAQRGTRGACQHRHISAP